MIAHIFPFNAEYQLDSAIYLNGSVDAPPEDGEDTWYRTNRYTWNKESSSFRIDEYLTSDSRLLGSYSGTVTSGENTMYVNTYDEEGFYYRTEIFTFIGDSVYESIETYYDDEEIKKSISFVIHNDSLYIWKNDSIQSIIVQNPENKNECLVSDTTSRIVKYIYEPTEDGLTYTSIGKYGRVFETGYFSKIKNNEGTTSIAHKLAPATRQNKFLYFDLKGRNQLKPTKYRKTFAK